MKVDDSSEQGPIASYVEEILLIHITEQTLCFPHLTCMYMSRGVVMTSWAAAADVALPLSTPSHALDIGRPGRAPGE